MKRSITNLQSEPKIIVIKCVIAKISSVKHEINFFDHDLTKHVNSTCR